MRRARFHAHHLRRGRPARRRVAKGRLDGRLDVQPVDPRLDPRVKRVVGWREWNALPDLGIDRIKAKVDTGARSSSLHAYGMERFRRRGKSMLRFKVHPMQREHKLVVAAEAELLEMRKVRSSSGAESLRPVIVTDVQIGEERWPIELTLTRRDAMGFRMLLGRQAVRRRLLVDPGASFLTGNS